MVDLRSVAAHFAISSIFESYDDRMDLLDDLAAGIRIVEALPFDVNLRKVQNIYYELAPRFRSVIKTRKNVRDADTFARSEQFRQLGEKLGVRMEGESS